MSECGECPFEVNAIQNSQTRPPEEDVFCKVRSSKQDIYQGVDTLNGHMTTSNLNPTKKSTLAPPKLHIIILLNLDKIHVNVCLLLRENFGSSEKSLPESQTPLNTRARGCSSDLGKSDFEVPLVIYWYGVGRCVIIAETQGRDVSRSHDNLFTLNSSSLLLRQNGHTAK